MRMKTGIMVAAIMVMWGLATWIAPDWDASEERFVTEERTAP